MHALSYHVPVFIKNHKTFKQFTGQGAEKNNDDANRIFFQKPNKWNAARDVLQLEAQQQASITVKGKRENMKKTMNTGVVELLSHIKKRMHSKLAGFYEKEISLCGTHLELT